MSDYYERSESTRSERRRKKRRKVIIRRIFVILFFVIVIGLITLICVKLFGGKNTPTDIETTAEEVTTAAVDADDVYAKAETMAASYDYDGAIKLLQTIPNYEKDKKASSLISQFETTRDSCVTVDTTKVPHIFFHTLIVDFERCFKPSHNQKLADGYNSWMVTIDEFNKIIEQLYKNDYVIINISDIYTKDANGNYTPNTNIKLPQGKKACVFSYDDPAYYCQYRDWGMADRMIIDNNGEIKCEYTDEGGKTTVGNFDHVPILVDFCKVHPDFSYHGHKGTLALTGYNGVFGCRTEYRMFDYPSTDEKAWLNEHPDCTRDKLDQYIAEAKKIAGVLKDNGFEFASHSWGHRPFTTATLDWLKSDTSWWKERVASIVGDTEILVYPHGADIAKVEDYTMANDKYAYLKSQGFSIFCGVDGSLYTWNQFRSDYIRQNRINIDGYLMYSTLTGKSSTLTKLGLDVKSIFDNRRKTPITAQ